MNRSRRHPAAPGVQRDLQTEEGDLMADTVLAGILTNYLTIILGALAGMALLIFRLRRILRFYGIRQRQDTIRIVIPRLDVQPRGAVGATAVSKGYVGTAVAQPDYEAAVLIQEQLRPNVSARLPREVRDWISGKWALAAAVNPIIELAPALPDAQSWLRCHSETNLILLGGPVYNAIADHYLKPKAPISHSRVEQLAPVGMCSQSVAGHQGPRTLSRAGPRVESWQSYNAFSVRTQKQVLQCAPGPVPEQH